MDRRGSSIAFSSRDEGSYEEKKSRTEEDISPTSSEEQFLGKSKRTHYYFENVRFTPKVMEFLNAYEGKQFSEKLTIQNIGKDPVYVKIGEPNSFIFQLKKPTIRAKFLASGSSICKTVSYTFHNDDLVQRTQIPIHVNGLLMDYPIIVKKAKPEIEVQPQKLHFEMINLGASAKSMTLSIINSGGKRTKFEIDCGNNMDLSVTPMRGTVKPKQSVNVRVEIMGFVEGEYYRELWIKTLEVPLRVPVFVEVVRPRLEIVYPAGTQNFTLIDFEAAFRGTQRIGWLMLKNVSTENTQFVALAELEGTLEVLKNAKKISDSFKAFDLVVEEGNLAPFETRVFNVLFCPKKKSKEKGWHHKEYEKKKQTKCDHVVFFNIQSIFSYDRKKLAEVDIQSFPQLMTEAATKPPSTAPSSEERQSSPSTPVMKQNTEGMTHLFSQNMPEDKPLRFCLHGQVVDPDILIQPTCFDFGSLFLGQTENKVLRVTNNSVLPVKCKICKMMNITTDPEVVWLKCEKAQEFLISLTPKCAGEFNTKMKIEILAESDVFGPAKKTLVTVAVYNVNIYYIARDPPLALVPKIGLGITPLVVDEVGFQKELITFKDASKLPYAAVLGLKTGFKPEWMKMERDQLNNVDNAIVALPNDRQGLVPSWPKNQICRSIFTGVFRYSPPEDLTYTLSHEGRIEQKKRREVWNGYILGRLDTMCHPELKTLKREFSGLDLPTAEKASAPKIFREIKDSSHKKTMKKPLNFPMIPLSPMFLFHVVVEPKLINFSLVAIATKTEETITINNMNDFPVSVRFIPGNESVTVLENTNLIPAESTKSVKVFLEAKDFGRYFGFLNYVINEAHEFKVTISALVISKTLTLNKKNLCLDFVTCDTKARKETFLPNSVFLPLQNVLQTPVKYKMKLSDDSIFVLDITEGVIPPKTTLLAEVYFRWCPKKSFYSEVGIYSEGGASQLIKLSYPNNKVAVHFLTDQVDMKDIPLNLPTIARPEILNDCYHDVSFEVLTSRPMPGVIIFPKEGIIKARSIFHLDIVVEIPVVMRFFFDVHLNVHFSNRISVGVTGNVVFPLIRIKPSELNLRKICENSFETFTISAINEGSTRAEVKLDFSACPEFKVIEGPSELSINPSESEKFLIRFDPVNPTRYVFYLPLIINKILGPPMVQEEDSEFAFYYIAEHESDFKGFGQISSSENSKLQLPCVCINCTVASALLSVTPLIVEFQPSKNSEFKPQSIVIGNLIDDEITFCISRAHVGEDTDSPFDVIPVREDAVEYKFKTMRARLRPNEKLVLMATYQPKTYGKHTANIPIFVKGYGNGQVYNLISLSGMLKEPRITPTSSEVYFPALPLGVANEVVLTISAENYTTPDEIKCLIWESPNAEDDLGRKISTKWLTEPIVCGSGRTQTFKLQISFQSFIPTALRTYLILIDSTGTYATILVSALTDNSVVTIHSFLYAKGTMYKLLRNPTVFPKPTESRLPPKQSETKFQRNEEKADVKMASKSMVVFDEVSPLPEVSPPPPEPVEQGPTLILQMTRSALKLPQLGFVKVIKNLENPVTTQNSGNYDLVSTEQKISLLSQSESLSTSRAMLSYEIIGKTTHDEICYPDFPTRENVHWNYFHATINLVERWIFEVVMRCDVYLSIPQSFQNIKSDVTKVDHEKKTMKMAEMDFLSFLEEIIGSDRGLPKRPIFKDKSPIEIAYAIQAYFVEVLMYLKAKGCLLPHIRAEYLMDYEHYAIYCKSVNQFETFAWEYFDLKGNNSKVLAEPSTVLGNFVSKISQTPKQNSSVFFPKDLWVKSLSQSLLTVEMESTENTEEIVVGPRQLSDNLESAWALVQKKVFQHDVDILGKATFELRSTQAWFDVILQIFRIFVLSKVFKKNTIQHVKMVEMCDTKIIETANVSSLRNYLKRPRGSMHIPIVDSFSSNAYSVQERILLGWINHHMNTRKDIFKQNNKFCYKNRILNNLDKDLSDSVAFICVTASHCPYIVSDYFMDVFWRPETPQQMLHNAGRLVQAWRTLQIGLTVETHDIIKPNPVFMIMLVTHLYEILPLLCPRSHISFSAPLNTEVSRTIQVRNDSSQRLVYQAVLFGEYERFFFLPRNPIIEVKPTKSVNVTIVFSVIKIQKISATLLLSGCSTSPDFAKPMVFYLEGEPSDISEHQKMSFCAPLYKVICTEIPIKPPYSAPTTYEIWYTTKKPVYLGESEFSFKKWSSIWTTKVARRLFLNKSEITVQEKSKAHLNITVACLTNKKRFFWLLFRSEIGDFIVLIEITPKPQEGQEIVRCTYPEDYSPNASCTCLQTDASTLRHAPCPILGTLKIPCRNDALWQALRKMFLKTLHPQEVSFWDEHLEMDIGICLMLWLLSPDEEEGVLDEFIDVLNTKMTYKLSLEPPEGQGIIVPSKIEIQDVRSRTEISVPIHFSKEISSKGSLRLTMMSENEKEIRTFKIRLAENEKVNGSRKKITESVII